MRVHTSGQGFEIVTNDDVEIKCSWNHDTKQITVLKQSI